MRLSILDSGKYYTACCQIAALFSFANMTLSIPFSGFAPIFPDICYHLTHYKPAAADIPVASDNPAH
ncbi:hypothetical protein, partial [Escherichia coli]|uniref:hypothetical protein n=1 Tax=Escherichia coli TaxID=562 RepID=UPI001BDBA6E5